MRGYRLVTWVQRIFSQYYPPPFQSGCRHRYCDNTSASINKTSPYKPFNCLQDIFPRRYIQRRIDLYRIYQ